jgi:hypothetical protein
MKINKIQKTFSFQDFNKSILVLKLLESNVPLTSVFTEVHDLETSDEFTAEFQEKISNVTIEGQFKNKYEKVENYESYGNITYPSISFDSKECNLLEVAVLTEIQLNIKEELFSKYFSDLDS